MLQIATRASHASGFSKLNNPAQFGAVGCGLRGLGGLEQCCQLVYFLLSLDRCFGILGFEFVDCAGVGVAIEELVAALVTNNSETPVRTLYQVPVVELRVGR